MERLNLRLTLLNSDNGIWYLVYARLLNIISIQIAAEIYRHSQQQKQKTILTFTNLDLTLYIQTHFLSYGCDNFLRINSRGERYPSALCG